MFKHSGLATLLANAFLALVQLSLPSAEAINFRSLLQHFHSKDLIERHHQHACLLSWIESDGVFCTSEPTWAERKRVAQEQWRSNRDSNLMPQSMQWVGRTYFQENWHQELHCSLMERLGKQGDGGKWICDAKILLSDHHGERPCLVYSFGSSNDFSFENAVLARFPHCQVHTFDFTSNPPGPNDNPNIQFHKDGIGQQDAPPFKTLETIIRELNHTGRNIDLFKIDVEWAEYQVLPPLLADPVNSPLRQARQILIELHISNLDQAQQLNSIMVGLHKLGFGIFAKEPNIQYAGGDCVEYGFVRVSPSLWD